MQELLDHIKKLNAEAVQWESEGKDRWASKYPEDEAYWLERKITTLAQFEEDQDMASFSDWFKSVVGFRPTGYTLEEAREWMATQSASEKAAKVANEEIMAKFPKGKMVNVLGVAGMVVDYVREEVQFQVTEIITQVKIKSLTGTEYDVFPENIT